MIRSHSGNISVSFFLRSLKYDGLIFQLKRGSRAYFTVFLRSGTIHVAVYSSIAGSSMFVTDGEKSMVTIDIHEGFLYLNNAEILFGPGNLTSFEVKAGDVVYLGGLPEVGDTTQWGGHFKGCLQDVRLDDTQFYMSFTPDTPKADRPIYLSRREHNLLENCVSDQACRVSIIFCREISVIECVLVLVVCSVPV